MARQIELKDWPVGLEHDIAFLRLDPGNVRIRSKIDFARERDGLDEFDGAVVRLDGERAFALQHYRNAPVSGTKLIVNDLSLRSLNEILKLLQLKRSDISWISPKAEATMNRAFRLRYRDPPIGRHHSGRVVRRRLASRKTHQPMRAYG